jgi:thioredoxin-dependent peroxiredoxin
MRWTTTGQPHWLLLDVRMAITALGGNPTNTVSELPEVGTPTPDIDLTGSDFAHVTRSSDRRTVLNIFPSIDTGVCSASVRKFNELASELENTDVICASADLPFALARFCGVEGIENVTAASSFRSSFGNDFGVSLVDGRFQGLLARAVIVIDTDGTILHTELVPEIGTEPHYEDAIAALA